MGDVAAAPTRCGYVALIGAPNAGKSTLLNQLVGQKLAIVTPKAQTTRSRLLGIAILGPAQLILIDTPGIFAPRRRLDRAMVAAAWSGAADADQIVLLVDAARPADPDTRQIIDRLAASGRPCDPCAQQDRSGPPRPPPRHCRYAVSRGLFRARLHDFGFDRGWGRGFEAASRLAVPPGPWLFPEDQLSDAPERWLAAEVTREQVFLQLHDELPYSAAVETEAWQERTDGSVRIDQVIYVRREGQRAIVLGDKGSADQGDRRPRPRRTRNACWSAASISSCSSRCATTGSRIPSATPRSDSTTMFRWNGATPVLC